MSRAYYNEINPYAVQWLRNLIAAGLIPDGYVDNRSIEDVGPGELDGFTQCHFFAGVGGWPLALRLAGWPDDRPVWTGSCPCQSFSQVGAKRGREDERHLWPTWFRLIVERAPPIVFGEQVASAITHGWLDEIFHGLENKAYACASAVLRACAVNKSHERRRVFFVAEREEHDDHREPRELPEAHEWQAHEGQEVGDAEFSDAATLGKRFLVCRDGLKKEAFPDFAWFSHGLPDQLDIEQALGNAIVPTLGAEFIKAYMEING